METLFFKPDEPNPAYKLDDVGYGAKFWRKLMHITRISDKRKIGILCYQHTQISQLVNIKFENELLYDSDCFEVVCDVIMKLGLQFKGISRIDLAADFNTFKGNLLPETLIKGYLSNKYLKGGTNKYLIAGHHNYFAYGESEAVNVYDKRPILDQQRRAEEEQRISEYNKQLIEHGLPPVSTAPPQKVLQVGDHSTTSITWGNRGSGVQVQLYNKTREMQEVAPKWHIVKTWQAAGLDLRQDVWRLEVRICTRGKELVNLDNGQAFKLSLIDLLAQEQVESLYFSYVAKYFKWYRNDGHKVLRNCKELKLFDVEFAPIVKPCQYSRKAKTYNRTAKLLVKYCETLRAEADAVGNDNVANLMREAKTYFTEVYKLGEWLKQQEIDAKLEAGELPSLPPTHVPLDRRYYSSTGLRALAVEKLEGFVSAMLTQTQRAAVDTVNEHKGIIIDWDKLELEIQNVLSIFCPSDDVRRDDIPSYTPF